MSVTLEQPQPMVALAKAQAVRKRRNALLALLKHGEVTLDEVLRDPSMARAGVGGVLERQRFWSVQRAEELLEAHHINYGRECGKLTERQLVLLAASSALHTRR